MSELIRKLFSSDFMPHGYCYLWRPQIVWLHAISDATITLAYFLIAMTLFYFVRKRRDAPFNWMFVLFGIFILGCGTTHLMEVWTIWHGAYLLAGVVKAITAGASIATAALLVPLIPRVLSLPSPAQLTAANLELEREIGQRRQIEEALQNAHKELEVKVQQRTVELARANYQLRVEIGERQRAEDALRKQASLLELAHDAIIVRDMDGIITFWNSGAAEVYGWQRDEALGKRAQDLLQSAYPSDVQKFNAEVIRKERWDGELIQSRQDGRKIVVASRWALQRDDRGEPAATLQINRDITERKQAEENLRRSEAFLAEGQSLSHTGSFGWKASTGELEFSRETFRVLGFDAEQPAPFLQVALQRIHADDRALVDRILDRAVQEKKDYELDARLTLPEGSTKYVHAVGRPLTNELGDLEFVGTLMDVTDRKEAEQTLQTAQAQLAHMARVITMGELAASIAHEVNQPLAAVVANASACLRWLGGLSPNLDEARATVGRIIKEGTRAGEVIGRIRSLMKKTPPRMSALDINAVINEVLALTGHEIRRHGVSLETKLADGLPTVVGDPVQLQQVMLNLILNGIEATSAKSADQRELIVTSQNDGPDRVVIAVQDSGVGIDPRKVDKLFEPFFTTKISGMGMGLSISRSAVEAHGGRLWATPNQGPGATFQFSLPAG